MADVMSLFHGAEKAYEVADFKEALSILVPLSEKNVPEALSLLGLMYQLGDGVEVDGVKAVSYLMRAVELGQGVAAHNLGTIYAIGIRGILSDIGKSKYYYRLAKSMGSQFAPDEFYE